MIVQWTPDAIQDRAQIYDVIEGDKPLTALQLDTPEYFAWAVGLINVLWVVFISISKAMTEQWLSCEVI